MVTQKRIYELAQLIRNGDTNAVREMDSLKQSGEIVYDTTEYWYRPAQDIGKPLDMAVYRAFFGEPNAQTQHQ